MADKLYTPKFKPQLCCPKTIHSGHDCNMAAAAMELDEATLGKLDKNHDQMRKASGDNTGGTTIEGAATALAKYGVNLHVYDSNDGKGFETVTSLLAQRRRVIAHGDYDQIPRSLRGDKDFLGFHSVYFDELVDNGTAISVGDPLNDGRRAGIPKGFIKWPIGVARNYMEKFDRAVPGKGLVFGATEHHTAIARVRANVRTGPSRTASTIVTVNVGTEFDRGLFADRGESINGDGRWFRVWLPAQRVVGYMHASVIRLT